MSDTAFKLIVVGLLCAIFAGQIVVSGNLGTVIGTTEYLAMKARQPR